MIDKDRQFVYSNIIILKRKGGTVSIAENPVSNYLSVVSSDRQQLSIFNSGGQLLKTFTTQATFEKIDVSGYAAGVYYLKGNGVMLQFVIAR